MVPDVIKDYSNQDDDYDNSNINPGLSSYEF